MSRDIQLGAYTEGREHGAAERDEQWRKAIKNALRSWTDEYSMGAGNKHNLRLDIEAALERIDKRRRKP